MIKQRGSGEKVNAAAQEAATERFRGSSPLFPTSFNWTPSWRVVTTTKTDGYIRLRYAPKQPKLSEVLLCNPNCLTSAFVI